MDANEAVDLVVVGSGLAGMIAAVRGHDLGLRVVMVEKCAYYGGTSAFSGGGIWIPNHRWMDEGTPEGAVAYLHAITRGKGDDRLFRTFVETGPVMAEYVLGLGVKLFKLESVPDYFSEVAGSATGRQLSPHDFDGRLLGEEFHRMRTSYPGYFVNERYQLGIDALGPLMNRQGNWLWHAFKLVVGYWADIGWRMKTPRDSRLSLGSAFVGTMRKAMLDRNIPLLLNTPLEGVNHEGGKVTGVRVSHNGNQRTIAASAVVLAAGGFDQNQAMRDTYHSVPTRVAASLTPPDANQGDAIRAGIAIGADLANMDQAWWCPSVRLPGSRNYARIPAGQTIFDRARPGSVCVNRLGKRFVNEACSYDRFGNAMIADHHATGANVPCWMVFDAGFRHKYNISDLLPGWAKPDRKLPPEYWDSVLYRADTIEDLARKIAVDPATLAETVAAMNRYAAVGKDPEFGRGDTVYDRAFGDPGVTPNPNLGPIDRAPFYAIKLELGDLGTSGGLRTDEHARVLDIAGSPIGGLYAAGNTAATLFCDTYPGPGSTLGSGMTFAFIAAAHAAQALRGGVAQT